MNNNSNKHTFQLTHIEFQLRFINETKLPADKGSCFHGAFGQALAKIGTPIRDFFYNPNPPPH